MASRPAPAAGAPEEASAGAGTAAGAVSAVMTTTRSGTRLGNAAGGWTATLGRPARIAARPWRSPLH